VSWPSGCFLPSFLVPSALFRLPSSVFLLPLGSSRADELAPCSCSPLSVGAQVTVTTFFINYAHENGGFSTAKASTFLSYSLIIFT
jgi:hypothetical protein